MKKSIGKVFGIGIVEDNTVKEVRMPKEMIEYLRKIDSFK